MGYIPGMPQSPTPGYSNITNFKIDTFVLPPPVVIIPGLNTDPTPAHTNTSAKSKKKKKGSGQTQASSNGVADLSARMAQSSICEKPRNPSGQPVATDPAKKLRNLRKKLRDIEALEARLNSGEIVNPEPEQVDKIARKEDVIKEISALEKITASQG